MKYEIKQFSTSKGQPNIPIFVKRYHYTKSMGRGCNRIFVLHQNNKIKGVALFGPPVGMNCQRAYSTNGKIVLELKRFVLGPKAEKNLASWFMAKCISVIKQDKTIESILSYADPAYGHTGIIYKASNYTYKGTTMPTRMLLHDGQKYHARIVYDDTKLGKELRNAYKKGKAKFAPSPGKHIFLYRMDRK